jgi:peptide/nickel transport system substrate-binding protein
VTRTKTALLTALLLLLPLFGAHAQGTLIVGMQYEPVTLDPHVTGQANAIRILNNAFDTLIYADDQGGLNPHLATSWEISDDGLTYTFTLREGVTFHDGTPFNAEAVRFTFERIMDPATLSQSAISAIAPYASSEVLGDYQIRFTLSEPSAIWLRNIATGPVGIVSPAGVAALGDRFARTPVGSGPFIITEWIDKDSVVMVKNPDYAWAPEAVGHQGPAHLDRLVFRFIPENQVRFGTLETGETNIIEDVPALFVRFLDANPSLELVSVPYPGSARQFMINTQTFPTDDVAVRRAILLATNVEGIIASLYAGVPPIGNGPMTASTYGAVVGIYRDTYPYDPEAAKQVLDEAGWVVGADGIRVKDGQRLALVANVLADVPEYGELTQVVQAQVRDIGMDMSLKSLSRSPWFASNAEGDYNLVGMALWNTDPNMLRMLYGTNGSVFTWSHYSNPAFDALVNEGARITDADARLALYAEAQQILMDDAVVLPVYDQVNLLGKQTNIEGIYFDQNAYPRYYTTRYAN